MDREQQTEEGGEKMESNFGFEISDFMQPSSFSLCSSSAHAERRRGSKEPRISLAIEKVLVASFRLLHGPKINAAGKWSETGISPFRLGFRAFPSFDLQPFFPAPQKISGKNSLQKTLYSSRKTASAKCRFRKTAKTSEKQLGVLWKKEK
jgi:hypothetical protein